MSVSVTPAAPFVDPSAGLDADQTSQLILMQAALAPAAALAAPKRPFAHWGNTAALVVMLLAGVTWLACSKYLAPRAPQAALTPTPAPVALVAAPVPVKPAEPVAASQPLEQKPDPKPEPPVATEPVPQVVAVPSKPKKQPKQVAAEPLPVRIPAADTVVLSAPIVAPVLAPAISADSAVPLPTPAATPAVLPVPTLSDNAIPQPGDRLSNGESVLGYDSASRTIITERSLYHVPKP